MGLRCYLVVVKEKACCGGRRDDFTQKGRDADFVLLLFEAFTQGHAWSFVLYYRQGVGLATTLAGKVVGVYISGGLVAPRGGSLRAAPASSIRPAS